MCYDNSILHDDAYKLFFNWFEENVKYTRPLPNQSDLMLGIDRNYENIYQYSRCLTEANNIKKS